MKFTTNEQDTCTARALYCYTINHLKSKASSPTKPRTDSCAALRTFHIKYYLNSAKPATSYATFLAQAVPLRLSLTVSTNPAAHLSQTEVCAKTAQTSKQQGKVQQQPKSRRPSLPLSASTIVAYYLSQFPERRSATRNVPGQAC